MFWCIALKLSKKKTFNLKYGALEDQFKDKKNLTARHLRETIIKIRNEKLPNPEVTPNAGSFFKNPIVSIEIYQKIKASYPNIPSYRVCDSTCKIPAGWLIEHAGWKGKKYEKVGVHPKQALVLVNFNNAKGSDLLLLAHDIQHDIEKKFAIKLDIEPAIYPSTA